MKILISGANGQLGNELISILKNGKSEIGNIGSAYVNCEIIAADVDNFDITNQVIIEEFLTSNKPDIVINCAAMTNVDGCETNEETAMQVNALGPRNLAIACNKAGIKLVHISTDYVFDGVAKVPYREWDLCNPQSIYGKSKYMGEEFVRQFCKKYFIIRTAWLYGYVGKNFVKTMLKLGSEKSEIKVVNDQFGNPTNANDLAYHILKVAETENYGTYHCTGIGEVSWCTFAKKIMEYANLSCKVIPCTTEEFPTPAKRPAFSSLDNLMLKSTVGDEMRPWSEALEMYIKNLEG